jgi:hypothetical protein
VRRMLSQDDIEILDQVVTVRLASELRRRISTAARTKGVSISEEIRRRLAVSFARSRPVLGSERACE